MIIEVNGIELYYRDIGYGSPVILLHGYGQSNDAFRIPERYLMMNHRVILIDSRGHGKSGSSDEPFSISLMAADVAAVMDSLKIERAAIIGFSDGGNIALQLAVDFPERISSIVAISCNARPEGLKQFYFRLLTMRKRLMSIFRVDTGKMELLLSEPKISNTDLSEISVPTLLIYGAHDLIAKQHYNELNHLIPVSHLKIIRGANHINIISRWHKYVATIEEFIQEQFP